MTSGFYAEVRSSLFGGKLKQAQVDGMRYILEASKGHPIKHRAYMLATAYHETGFNMSPNEESLNYTTAARIRAVWPNRFASDAAAQPYVRQPQKLANKVYNGRMGNRLDSNDGWTYRGRGQVHITGRTNYERAGIDGDPDRALDRDVSAMLLCRGMADGWFTGKKLSDYDNYVDMRRVVNDTDQAAKIAEYAEKFEAALNLIQGGEEPRRAFLEVLLEIIMGFFRK